jgi:hypothetical protein
MKPITKLAPKNARTLAQRCSLISECCDTARSYFLLTHAGLVISNHRRGQQSTGTVTLTRGEFERFIKFYETGQKLRREKKKR